MEFKEWLNANEQTVQESTAAYIQPIVWAAMQFVANQLGVPEGMGDEYINKVAAYVAQKMSIGTDEAALYVRCYGMKDRHACWALQNLGKQFQNVKRSPAVV